MSDKIRFYTTTDHPDISVFQQAPYEWKYGRQNEYTLTLYPMSMADQLKITGVIASVLRVVGEASKSIATTGLNMGNG